MVAKTPENPNFESIDLNQLWSFVATLDAPGSQDETLSPRISTSYGPIIKYQNAYLLPDGGGGGLEPQLRGFQEDAALGAAPPNKPILRWLIKEKEN